jgi:putative ABC transport system permease protein
MSVIWTKVWFDLWHNPSRTLLAMLSIAAGVFAVGAVYGMSDQLLSGMDRAHRQVFPSHINIILRDYVGAEVVGELEQIDGVVGIDPVNQLTLHYKISSEEDWGLATLVHRPDYSDQSYDRLELKAGQWPEAERIGIERLSSQYYQIETGDRVTFKLGGQEYSYTVSGKIRHPFVQPPLFGGQAHFFASQDVMETFGIPSGRYGQLLVQVEPYSLERAQDVAGEIRSYLAQRGYGVIVSLYQEPDRHWGRMYVEGINLVLQVMAVVSLFLSAMLVLNTMTAMITEQTDQIGVIKAIGGQRAVVIKIYLIGAAIYGLLALLLALPLSAWFAFGMSRWFLNLFNIDYLDFQFSMRALVLQGLASVVAPVLAASIPVLKGAAISVREAIATYGLGGDFGSSWLDRFVERTAAYFLSTPYAAAIGNMLRRKGRLALTLLVLTTAGVMFLVVMSLVSSIQLTLDNEMARQGYDVRIGFTRNQSMDDVNALIADVAGVESSEIWYSRNVTILREGERLQDSAGLGAQLIGIPPGTGSYRPIIVAGRWLEAGDDSRVIVISQKTAEKNRIAVGDSVTLDLGELGGEVWQVIGTYRVIYGAGFLFEPIYTPLSAMWQVTARPNEGTQLLVRGSVDTLAEETELASRLTSVLEEGGIVIDFYTTNAKRDQRVYADNQFNSVISMLISLAALVAMVGAIGLMGSLGISVVERRREIGVMRAIGARTPALMGLFVMEGVFQGLLSFLLSVPLAYGLAQPLARMLGQAMLEVDLDYSFNFPAVLIWMAAVLILSVLSSMLPAWAAARLRVRESLAYA